MKIQHTGIVLFVPNRDVWEGKVERFLRTRKRLESWITSVFGIALLGAFGYLAAMYYPLLAGDIKFGHPRYGDYRAGSDIAFVLVFTLLAVNWAVTVMYRRWLRKTNTELGLNTDGAVQDVREAIGSIPAVHGGNG